MGVEFFDAPLNTGQERVREQAVEASGALRLGDVPELQALVEDARRGFGTAMAAVSSIHSDWQYLLAAAGLPGGVYSRRASICGHTITRPERVFCVPDIRQDPRFADTFGDGENRSVGFYAGATLLDQNRVALGAFCVFDPSPRAMLTRDEAARLYEFAQSAMAVIRSRRG